MFLVTSNINGFFGNMQTWGEKGILVTLSAVYDPDSGVCCRKSCQRSTNLTAVEHGQEYKTERIVQLYWL